MGDDVVESCRCEGSKVVWDEWNFAVEGLDPPLQDGVEQSVLVAEVDVYQTLVVASPLCNAVNASTGQADSENSSVAAASSSSRVP